MFASHRNGSTANNNNLDISYVKCPMDLTPNGEPPPKIEPSSGINGVAASMPNVAVAAAGGRAPITKIFIDDLTERRKLWRVPWFIVTVCILQISCYAVANDCMNARLWFTRQQQHAEYWRYLTYMLVHSDRLHLLLNVVLQCAIGFWLECEQGGWRVAIVYAVGGISGSMAMGMLQPTLSLIGASAGVYALLLSHVPHLLKNFSQLQHRYLRIVALIILCLSDIVFTALHYHTKNNTNPRICLEAHIAGALSGLCLGLLLYKRLTDRHGQYHTTTNTTIVTSTRTCWHWRCCCCCC